MAKKKPLMGADQAEEDPAAAPAPKKGAPPADTGMMPDDEEAEGAQPASEEEGGGEEGTANPMEQRDYNVFLNNCLKTIYTPDGDFASLKEVLRQLANAKDFGLTLANITVTILRRVAASAKQAGHPVDSSVLLQGGKTILEDVATLAMRADLHDFTEAEMEGAFYRAIDLYRDLEPPSEEDKTQIQREFQALVQANKDGTLNQLVPGADEAGQRLKPAVDKVVSKSEKPEPEPTGLMPGQEQQGA